MKKKRCFFNLVFIPCTFSFSLERLIFPGIVSEKISAVIGAGLLLILLVAYTIITAIRSKESSGCGTCSCGRNIETECCGKHVHGEECEPGKEERIEKDNLDNL